MPNPLNKMVLPDYMNGPNIDENRQWNRMVDCLKAISFQAQAPEKPPPSMNHPFKISVTQNGAAWDATVSNGTVHVTDFYDDGSNRLVWGQVSVEVDDGTGNNRAGQLLTMQDNTDYGIWLQHTIGSNNLVAPPPLGDGVNFLWLPITASALFTDLTSSATHTVVSDLSTLLGTTNSFGYTYLGQVSILSGVVTIDQRVIGDVWTNCMHCLGTIISADADNIIVRGSDSGLWTTIEAGSSPGGISVAIAGGTVTLDNTGVTKIIAGDNITISPTGGTGNVTVTNDGVLSIQAGASGNPSVTVAGGAGTKGHIQLDHPDPP